MDLIIYNANIHTMDSDASRYQALAVKDAKITALGTDHEILERKSTNTVLYDLKGASVYPGFNDSHLHLLGFGASLKMCLLNQATSVDHMIDIAAKYLRDHPIQQERWLTGRGWNQDYFDKPILPTAKDLDRISETHPIYLTRACGHIAVANSKAMAIAGIDRHTAQIDGGRFDTDADGNPTGIFRENAMDLILSHLSAPTVEEIKDMIMLAGEYALSQGITSVQSDDLCVYPEDAMDDVFTAFRELDRDGRLPVRVYEQALFRNVENLNRYIGKGYLTGRGTDYFKEGPLKILGDGSLGARTAFLREPYTDDPGNLGIALYTQEELDAYVLTAHENKIAVAIHGIGDGMIERALNAIENAQKKRPDIQLRHSLVHCQITDMALMKRFADLNVIAHIQPIFIDYDQHIAEQRLGPDRVRNSYNWKAMLDLGIVCGMGSDCPVEPLDVLPNIYTAVTRKDLKGRPENGWMPDQKLSMREAVEGFTKVSAYCSGEELIKGTLEMGKLADFTILDKDLFRIDPEELLTTKVLMTFVGGDLKYAFKGK